MRHSLVLLVFFAMLLASCGNQPTATTGEDPQANADTDVTQVDSDTEASLVVMSHDSFNVSTDVIQDFEAQAGVTVEILPSGDTGSALNKAILSKDAPLADVFFGVDNTFLSRALEAGIFEPYKSPALANIPDEFKLDSESRLLPIDYGYVNINYDQNYLTENELAVPETLEVLTEPDWEGKLIVQNPATSSPGLAFMLATINYFGTEGDYTWLDFWRDLRANDALITDGWEEGYYTHFSGSSGAGPRPLVVSYATSPAAEVFFSEGTLTKPPTGNLLAGSFRQIEFAGILSGTQQRETAERFLDFMLSPTFQEDIPLQMFVYPVLPEAAQPEVFEQFAQIPEATTTIAPEEIEQNREQWIEEWTEVMLR
ncbi:MAG: thiamine ABC transporter substrate-binding protein [Chloroflexi bacterium AL-W]|nr:thiamine ABC transporter substrate-binding protein [Chloroflexi bacterium AL-N1]NOK67061.1 thiamine ABC transporter substrate-binding protein [Chloroflexi bacterium AL-N10]NOK74647.1 thiamine ABC transporter substrate-binding protein [Chloroflexi bacterium AL-N5]NOK81663.1 thiamine ABC transporter substrate-binding protein [Chloroflexi bacterium AL-W]NOK89133.1 thiamine ABC transporter substrate-binding protein [Chloroflexi bacterium AL-N15]